MTMRDFIRENRDEIDRLVNACLYRHDGRGGAGTVPDPPPTRDDELRKEKDG